MNFDKLLERNAGRRERANKAREKAGFEPVTLIGWAEKPHLRCEDAQAVLGEGAGIRRQPEHTLNYNIRVLGRRGVLVLNAVSSMEQFDTIAAETENVLSAVSFNEGHRYTDYLPGTDKAATYGVAGFDRGRHCGQGRVLQGGVARPAGLQEGPVGRSRRRRCAAEESVRRQIERGDRLIVTSAGTALIRSA